MTKIVSRFTGLGGLVLGLFTLTVFAGTGSLGIAFSLFLVFGIPLWAMSDLPAYATRGSWFWNYVYTLICTLIFLFLIAPVLVVIPLSFNAEPYFTFTQKMLSFDPDGYSLRWYDNILKFGMLAPDAPRDSSWFADMWANAQWIRAAKNSVIIGIFSTILATTLGTLAALGLSRPEMPYRRTIMAVLISPMIVPLVIVATGLFFFYSDIGLAHTYVGVIMAHATLGIPFVIITVTATLVGFDHSLTRAAQSLGANDWTTFRQVILPLILPGVISGALFAFVTSFDEVVVVLFVASFDQQTIPRQMWNGIREQISPTILAVATILVLISVALLATVELLRRRSERLRGLSPG
jgi:putative spermidine/putrescine transport system permease protein